MASSDGLRQTAVQEGSCKQQIKTGNGKVLLPLYQCRQIRIGERVANVSL